jgi:drug/metabolite transporter (DMT)-like permease
VSWLALALGTALFESLKDLASKRGLNAVDPMAAAWGFALFSLPVLAPAALVAGIPAPAPAFGWALAAGALLNAAAVVQFMRAIAASDLSLSVPFITFTPLFLLVTSPLMLGEVPTPAGMLGVALVVFGAYWLNAEGAGRGPLAPFKAMLTRPGPRRMLSTAFLWSITSNLDKIGVTASAPIFWVLCVNALMALLLTPLALRHGARALLPQWRALLPIGVFNALTVSLQMVAIQLTLVAYVIAVKRTSAVITVLLAHLLFAEGQLGRRMGAVVTMVVGVAVISLSSAA